MLTLPKSLFDKAMRSVTDKGVALTIVRYKRREKKICPRRSRAIFYLFGVIR